MIKSLLLVSLLVATANSAPTAGPYFTVLAGQQPGWVSASHDDLWNEIGRAIGNFVDTHRVKLPLGANGKLERVHQIFLRGELAVRHRSNGVTEVIGDADFLGDAIPHRYVGDHEVRPFRLTLDASGKLVAFSFQNVDNTKLTVVRPSFEPVTPSQAQQITDGIAAFFKARNATGDNLESALAGHSANYDASVVDVHATTTDFGELGRIARVTTHFRPKAGVDGSSFTYVLDVTSDKAGNVVSAGAVW